MSGLALQKLGPRDRVGLKGRHAPQWLAGRGIEVPDAPNTWGVSAGAGVPDDLLVARLGAGEFFLEESAGAGMVRAIAAELAQPAAGIYPVLREDAAYALSGDGSHDVLGEVCSFNFADLRAAARSVIMTMMIGVAVLVVAEDTAGGRRYRIWCDPTFESYLAPTLGTVVMEHGGQFTGAT